MLTSTIVEPSLASHLEDGNLSRWTLQDAKNGLSALIRAVRSDGPQRITLYGRDVAVVVAAEDYDQLTGGSMNLIEALRHSPLADALAAGELTIDRSPERSRDIEL